MESVGRVAALWRYPVKSMRGERLERAAFGARGVPGDRGFAVIDATTGRALSAKSVPVLLQARAVARPGGPVIVLPDGNAYPVERAAEPLSAWLGRAVRVEAPPAGRTEVEGDGTVFRSPAGTFFDGATVHLVTTAMLAHLSSFAPDSAFDARRFRPNLVVETKGSGPEELSWIDRTLSAGDARLAVVRPCARCVVTTHEQEELPRDREVLRTIARENDNIVGVYVKVLEEGSVSLGDAVSLIRS